MEGLETVVIKNILLIDERTVGDPIKFRSYINNETVTIQYNSSLTNRHELEQTLSLLFANELDVSQFPNVHVNSNIFAVDICRIGFVFSTEPVLESSVFIENSSYVDDTNVEWLVGLLNKHSIATIDFFGCNTLIDAQWRGYYDILVSRASVDIYANAQLTGNTTYGGDWIFDKYETTQPVVSNFTENVEDIYFNHEIREYPHLFDYAFNHVMMVDNSDNMWVCGRNQAGQLGLGNNTARITTLTNLTIRPLSPSGEILAFGCGSNTCFISFKNGKLYAAGSNASGFLLNSSIALGSNSNIFIECSSNSLTSKTVSTVTNNSFNNRAITFLTTDGKVYSMGSVTGASPNNSNSNWNGQFGNGTTIAGASSELIEMSNNTTKIPDDVQTSSFTMIVRMRDGTVYGCGFRSRLGINASSGNATTIQPLFSDVFYTSYGYVKQISVTSGHMLALTTTNRIFGTGSNSNGQLGDASLSLAEHYTWKEMNLTPITSGVPVAISTGSNASIVLTNTGKLYGCGSNPNNILGIDFCGNILTLTECLPFPTGSGELASAVTCMSSDNSTFVLAASGKVYACGTNTNGQLARNNQTPSTSLLPMLDNSLNPITNIRTLNINYTPIVPEGPLSAPTITSIVASPSGDSQSISFTDPSGVIVTYYYSTDGTNYANANTKISPFTINVSSGTTVTLKASNASGNSNASNGIKVGSPPTIISATTNLTSVSVTFSIDNNGTPTLTKYRYSIDGGINFSDMVGTSSPLLIPDLTPGTTYNIVMKSASGSWTSPNSNAVSVQVAILGSAPVINSITPGTNQLSVAFSQSNLGTSPTTYYYSYSSNGSNPIGPVTSPFNISNVSETKTVYIIASNSAGDIISTTGVTGTPYIIGNAPTITSIVPANNSLIVNFAGSTGGVPAVQTYFYSLDGGSYTNANTTTSPITIRNLTISKSYTVTLLGRSLAGDTSSSNSASETPIVVATVASVTPATYWSVSAFWGKTSFWKKTTYWSNARFRK